MSVVVGTAGHIDHGKTTLLRALTGIDADRLPEERARGMTIDVGYAHLALGDGTELDFVDVPGHDRLVGNMLVGAGEIDAALLVVAADDGPRAQTIEHLELLDALGIGIGLAVVTKIDVVPAERVDAVAAEVSALLAGTSLAGSPVLPVSATNGEGLADLIAALGRARNLVLAEPGLAGPRPPRLAIDRVFSIRGRGTVVTGTLRNGTIEPGASLRIVPDPGGRSVRVREVQIHGRAVERAGPGRVALNVAGSDAVAVLERGMVLTTDPAVAATDRLLVALRPSVVLGPAGAGSHGAGSHGARSRGLPADRAPVTIHLGTGRTSGMLGRAGRDGQDLGGGESSAIVRLDRPIAAAPGDPFVLRRPSPAVTLAGGRILDPVPPRGIARRRTTTERLNRLATADPTGAAWRFARLDLHGVVAPDGPAVQLADDVAAVIDARLIEVVGHQGSARSAALIQAGAAALRRIAGAGLVTGDRTFTDRAVAARLERLIADGRLVRDGDTVRPPGARDDVPSAALAAAMDRLVAALAIASPPALSQAARETGCPPNGIRALERSDRIVRIGDDLAWNTRTYRELTDRALAMAATAPLTPAAYRDATGTSRKYVMAILEDLDRRAILRRTPAGHVPGPRAASAIAGSADPEPGPVR